MLITSLWIVDLLILLATITFLLYKFSTRHYDYFKKRNIYFPKPIPFCGNILPVISMKLTIGECLRNLYNSIDEPYFGVFLFDEPCLIMKSPELIKYILVKDFNIFSDRTVLAPNHNKVISALLFFQKNPQWRRYRIKFASAFSSGKLKGMFTLIDEISLRCNEYIRKNLGKFEAKELATKFSTDVIAKCAFAMNAQSFDIENSEFCRIGKAIFDVTWRNAIVQMIYFMKPSLGNLFRLDFFSNWITVRLSDVFWKAIENREQNNIKGNDLIDRIVEMRKDKQLCQDLDFVEGRVVAQAIQFFLAGYETTSSTISFTLYELCIHPNIQDKLRKEILINVEENGFTYNTILNLKYMEMCILETLRKYPVLPFLDRTCNIDYKLPGTDLVIEKGTRVYIPMLGLHYDEKIFPEPEKYDPERFIDKKSYNVNGSSYLPFGEGPRICIGERFAMMSIKICLARILSEFIVEPVAETPVPVQFEPKCFLLQSLVGLPVRFRLLHPPST